MAPVPTTYDDYRARSYFAALDGVRAVAVLAVLTWHVGESDLLHELQGGRGVEWFFVLSGFLITTLALREEERDGRLAVGAFYVRRFFRIVPLYLVALLCTLLADFVVFRSRRNMDGWESYWPYYLTMLQDVPLNLGWPNAPFGLSWSLGVEEKFYLVWPLLGFVVLNAARRLWASAGLAAALAAVMLAWPGRPPARLLEWYLPIVLGCIVAILLNRRATFDRVAKLVRPAVLAGLALLVVLPLPSSVRGARGYPVVYAVLIALAIGACAVPSKVPVLGSRAAVWVGRRSYAIYLFHTQVIHVTEKAVERTPLSGELAGAAILVLAVPMALVVADVLHRVVERPLINVGRRLGARRPGSNRPSAVPSAA